MRQKIRILVLSTSHGARASALIEDEAKKIFERLQEGPCRDRFEFYNHPALRPSDLQKLLLMYEPHIIHFSGRGSQLRRVLSDGIQARGGGINHPALVEVFALYNSHVRLVLLNSGFSRAQARSLSEVINYSIGAGKGVGEKTGLIFSRAFYRALGFGKSVREAFASAKAELALTRLPRSRGIELFVRNGVSERDRFPRTVKAARRRNPSRRRHSSRFGRTMSTRLRPVAR